MLATMKCVIRTLEMGIQFDLKIILLMHHYPSILLNGFGLLF